MNSPLIFREDGNNIIQKIDEQSLVPMMLFFNRQSTLFLKRLARPQKKTNNAINAT